VVKLFKSIGFFFSRIKLSVSWRATKEDDAFEIETSSREPWSDSTSSEAPSRVSSPILETS
jgi:hypothetical protein